MSRRLAVLLLIAGCGPSQQPASAPTAESGEPEDGADVPPVACAFEPIAVDTPNRNPTCNGRLEAQCEAVEGCRSVFGYSITTYTDAEVECDPEPVFLGCTTALDCEEDSNFICAQDMRSIFATGGDCIPPTGWLACAPAQGAARVAELALGCVP